MSTLSLKQPIILKILTLVFLLLLTAIPSFSSAHFYGEAAATAGVFTAGMVSFSVPTAISVSVAANNPVTASYTITDTGNIDADYLITTTPVTCSAGFYNGLEARLENPAVIYDDALNGLNATSTTAGVVDLTLQASSTLIASQNETCIVEVTINAWQSGFPYANFGFSDTKTIILTITASEDIGNTPPILPLPTTNVVLNEIYPSLLATTTAPFEREWIELYNGTANPIDVANWTISEFTGGNINNTERFHKIIDDCAGYAVSTHAEPFGTNNTVILPGGYLVLQFCGTAEYLSNGGDTVRLYDDSGTSNPWVDSHTFGSTVAGKSHARIPDGGTWVDPVPTPGAHNVATKEDLEAENWTKEQIIAVLGEEVYENETEIIPAPKVATDHERFGFVTSAMSTTFESATTSTSTVTETASSSVEISIDSISASSTKQGKDKDGEKGENSKNKDEGSDSNKDNVTKEKVEEQKVLADKKKDSEKIPEKEGIQTDEKKEVETQKPSEAEKNNDKQEPKSTKEELSLPPKSSDPITNDSV